MDDAPTGPQHHSFEFLGNARDYFGIWIVNLVLTILTLGIYSAWAKVRTNRYFYNNTRVAGSSFDYTADPRKILIGRAIAVAMIIGYNVCLQFFPTVAVILLAVFLLFLPVVYISSIAFKMRYSRWRNISFRFLRDLPRAYWLFSPLLVYLLVFIAGPYLFGLTPEDVAPPDEAAELSDEANRYLAINGIMALLGVALFPLWQRFYYNYIGNRVKFGSSALSLNVNIRSFYSLYLATLGIAFLCGIAVFFLLQLMLDAEGLEEGFDLYNLLRLYGAVLLPYIVVFAFIKTRLTNMLYSGIRMEGVSFQSTLNFGRLLWLYLTNTIAIVCTVGMAFPWAKVRLAKYRAEHMSMTTERGIEVVAEKQEEVDAGADAMTDLFDLDIGL